MNCQFFKVETAREPVLPLAIDLIQSIKSQKSEIALAISLCNMAARL
jgi:hypothetical protein